MIAGNPCKYRDFKGCGSCLHAAGENDKRTRGNTIYLGSSLSSLAIFGYDCTVFSGTVISRFDSLPLNPRPLVRPILTM